MISLKRVLMVGVALCAGVATADYKQDALCVTGEATLCPTLPTDLTDLPVAQGYTPTTNVSDGDTAKQANFDYFGWQMFVALNWPADSDGNPTGHIMDDPDAPRVWESYAGVEQVFAGANLIADDAEAACEARGRMVLSQTGKLTTSSFIEPFTHSQLIDRDGLHLDLDFLVVQLALAEHLAKFLPGVAVAIVCFANRRKADAGGGRWQQRVQDAFLGGVFRAMADFRHLFFAGHLDGDVHQVANDRVHFTADVADLGELRRLDLHERRLGQLGEST